MKTFLKKSPTNGLDWSSVVFDGCAAHCAEAWFNAPPVPTWNPLP